MKQSETGTPVGNPVQLVAPGDFPAIEARIAPLRAFRRQIDGVLDPVVYVLRTTQVFEWAAAGHAPSAVLVAGSIFHERLHGTDDAVDEASVLTQEAAFLQRYIGRTVLRLRGVSTYAVVPVHGPPPFSAITRRLVLGTTLEAAA